MSYEMKPLACDPARIKGMSERLIVSHYMAQEGTGRHPRPAGPKPARADAEVDEASWQSFPASDPSSFTPICGVGRPDSNRAQTG
jgi:hypothetical protein